MRRIATVISVLWVLNFVGYVTAAIVLGGDAINGYAESGRYYLAMHGRLTEVSRSVYDYSRWHTYVLWPHTVMVLVMSVRYRSRANGGTGAPNGPRTDRGP